MSMFSIARFLEINRSVDGVRPRRRSMLLPARDARRRFPWRGRAALTPEQIGDLRPSTRADAIPVHRLGGRLLF